VAAHACARLPLLRAGRARRARALYGIEREIGASLTAGLDHQVAHARLSLVARGV